MSDMTADEIISAIERDEFTDEIENYIEHVDNFLLKESKEITYDEESKEITDFIEAFFNKSRERLISTVNSCIKSRNNKKKKDDLKKYKEGYFNEIVQNANDIVCKCEKINPDITIRLSKEKDNKYIVKCSYPDRGFTLKDVYGFCTRGNSNKSSENGQEGMYGIGIKSLFCFCDYFCIKNNIKLELKSINDKLLNEISIEPVDNKSSEGDCAETTLTFEFTYNEGREESNKYAGFNVKKLAELIDSFISGEDICEYFYSEEEDKTVFDIRGLMFTDTGENRNVENSIKSIILEGNNRKEEFTVDEKAYDRNIKISIINHQYKPEDDMKYFIFNYENKSEPDKSILIGYPLCDEICNKNDRIYATYFVANSQKPLLGEKTGCLINTKVINSSRSGFERENEKEPKILDIIKDKGKHTIIDIISILNDDNASNDFRKNAGNLLCKLLLIYKDVCNDKEEEEITPRGIFEGQLAELNKIFANGKLILLDNQKYILKFPDKDEIDRSNKSLNKNRPVNSDDEECRELFNVFKQIFIKEDVLYYNEDQYKELQGGIKNLCEYMFECEKKGWLSNIKFPFIKGAKELIELRIGGNDFDKIMKFISSKDEDDKLSIKEIVARYEVNDCFDFMGRYSANNIKNWLFGSECQDPKFKEVCEEYEKSYKELKYWLVSNERIREAEYYHSNNWNASSDYWYECKKGSWGDKAKESEITEKEIGQFLSLLSRKTIKIGYKYDSIYNLFSHNLDSENLKLRNRDRRTNCWDGSFKYFTLDFLDKEIKNFNNFKLFRQIIDAYNESKAEDCFKIKSLNKCILEEADLEMLMQIFKWISFYSHTEDMEMSVKSLQEIQGQDSDIIKFAQMFIGNIPIRLEKITVENNGAKFIGYISNLNSNKYIIKYRKSAGDVFREISDNTIDTSDEAKSLVIFYTDDEQEALEQVLSDMNGNWNELTNYIKNFINTGNIKQLSTNDYDKYLKRPDIDYTYKFEKENVNSIIDNGDHLSIEDIYEILSGEYSYDEHCPICNGIPTLNIKGDKKVSANKNCLVTLIPAKYKDSIIYVKIICCKSCFEEYKVSLTSAEILEEDRQKILLLKSTIKSSCRSYDFEKKIKLSPDNWKIIEEFNERKKSQAINEELLFM